MTVRCYDKKTDRWMVQNYDGTGWHPEGAPVVASASGEKGKSDLDLKAALDELIRLARAGKLSPDLKATLRPIVVKALAARPLTVKERLAAADRFLQSLDAKDDAANLADWLARKERAAALKYFGRVL